jgi:hypothetical protein
VTPDRIAALRGMAQADESPNERDIARTKLAEAGVPIDPPRPPAPPAGASMPDPHWSFSANSGATSTTTWRPDGVWIQYRVVKW